MGNFLALKPLVENLQPFFDETPESSEDKVDAEPLSGVIEVNYPTSKDGGLQLDFSTAFGWLTAALQFLAALMSFDKVGCLKAYATTVCPIF